MYAVDAVVGIPVRMSVDAKSYFVGAFDNFTEVLHVSISIVCMVGVHSFKTTAKLMSLRLVCSWFKK